MKIRSLLILGALLPAGLHAEAQFDWMARYVSPGDKVMCKMQREGEQFFVVRTGDRLRLGYRLDLTRYSSNNAFIAGWSLRDNDGRLVIAQIPPISVSDRNLAVDGRTLAEGVQEQTLLPSVSGQVNIKLAVKKCGSLTCERARTLGPDEINYTVDVCSAML